VVRLGGTATWMGRVGADGIGDLIRRELRAEGVECRLAVDDDAPTGLMVKSSPQGGRTRVDYHRRASAGSRLRPDDIDVDIVRAAGILHVTGITLALSESARTAVDRAVDIALEAGVPVSFTVNHRSRLWSAELATPHYRALAARVTIVVASDDEAPLLLASADGADALGRARRISALGPAEVIVTRGAEGCVAVIDGEEFTVPAVPVQVVDSVGAGDAFVAGYLAERLVGATAADRLTTAVRAGAAACLGPGDWESLPRREALADPGADPVTR
jgi:2-dehydro-3-deoxygluconokinase